MPSLSAPASAALSLYRSPELRAVIEDHRAHTHDRRTLTGLGAKIANLRTTLEAVADACADTKNDSDDSKPTARAAARPTEPGQIPGRLGFIPRRDWPDNAGTTPPARRSSRR